MDRQTKTLILVVVFALGIVFGEWVGVRDFKNTCEPLGNVQGARWLECGQGIQK